MPAGCQSESSNRLFSERVFRPVQKVSAWPAAWTASAADKGMPEELTVTQGWFDQFTAGYVWDLRGGQLSEQLGFDEGGGEGRKADGVETSVKIHAEPVGV